MYSNTKENLNNYVYYTLESSNILNLKINGVKKRDYLYTDQSLYIIMIVFSQNVRKYYLNIRSNIHNYIHFATGCFSPINL